METPVADRFVGIDVSKSWVDVHIRPEGIRWRCDTFGGFGRTGSAAAAARSSTGRDGSKRRLREPCRGELERGRSACGGRQ
jgi:hypothetical protein